MHCLDHCVHRANAACARYRETPVADDLDRTCRSSGRNIASGHGVDSSKCELCTRDQRSPGDGLIQVCPNEFPAGGKRSDASDFHRCSLASGFRRHPGTERGAESEEGANLCKLTASRPRLHVRKMAPAPVPQGGGCKDLWRPAPVASGRGCDQWARSMHSFNYRPERLGCGSTVMCALCGGTENAASVGKQTVLAQSSRLAMPLLTLPAATFWITRAPCRVTKRRTPVLVDEFPDDLNMHAASTCN